MIQVIELFVSGRDMDRRFPVLRTEMIDAMAQVNWAGNMEFGTCRAERCLFIEIEKSVCVYRP